MCVGYGLLRLFGWWIDRDVQRHTGQRDEREAEDDQGDHEEVCFHFAHHRLAR
jgi:hypothetical protein